MTFFVKEKDSCGVKSFEGKALYLETFLRTCEKFHNEILIACMVSEIDNE